MSESSLNTVITGRLRSIIERRIANDQAQAQRAAGGAILAAIEAFLKSPAGQALMAALIELLTGDLTLS